MKFELNKDQIMILLLAGLLLLAAIETYIRLSREERAINKELRKLDIELDTLLLKNREQKRLMEQIDRLAKAFPNAKEEMPDSLSDRIVAKEFYEDMTAIAPEPDEPTELSEYDQVMAIINDAYKAPELKAQFLKQYGIKFFDRREYIAGSTDIQLFKSPHRDDECYYKETWDVADILYPHNKNDLELVRITGYGDIGRVFLEYKKISDEIYLEKVPVFVPDHIPHEEKMVKEAAALEPPEPEPEDKNIYAPFDGEILENYSRKEGSIKIRNLVTGLSMIYKEAKMSSDLKIGQKVEKNQILGQWV